jgi:hypothetical protein
MCELAVGEGWQPNLLVAGMAVAVLRCSGLTAAVMKEPAVVAEGAVALCEKAAGHSGEQPASGSAGAVFPQRQQQGSLTVLSCYQTGAL